jgi:hypothetical protein
MLLGMLLGTPLLSCYSSLDFSDIHRETGLSPGMLRRITGKQRRPEGPRVPIPPMGILPTIGLPQILQIVLDLSREEEIHPCSCRIGAYVLHGGRP